MKLAFFLCSRNWRSRRTRQLTSTLGVALGGALVTAVLTMDHNTVIFKASKERKKYAEPDLEVFPTADRAASDELPKWLRSLPGVEEVTPVAMVPVSWGDRRGNTYQLTQVLAELDRVEAFQACVLDSGWEFTATGLPESPVWITKRMAKQAKLDVGDSLQLEDQHFVIAGLLKKLHLGFHQEIALTDWSSSRTPVSQWKGLRYWLRLDDPQNTDGFVRLGKAEGFLAQPPPTVGTTDTPEDIAMRNGLTICALLGLALGLFIVLHTLLMTVSERRREIALLHGLGATRRQISGAMLWEALVQSLLGTIGGVGLGLALAFVCGKVGISSIGAARYPMVGVPWTAVAVVAATGIVITLLGTLAPIVAARRLPTARILSPMGLETRRSKAATFRWLVPLGLAVVLGILHFLMNWLIEERAAHLARFALQLASLLAFATSLVFVAPGILHGLSAWAGRLLQRWRGPQYHLPFRNVSTQGHRNATAVCALMLVFASIYCMHTLTECLKDEVRTLGRQAMSEMVFVHHGAARAEEERALVREMPEVATLLAVQNETRHPLVIRGVDPHSLLDVPSIELSSDERNALQGLAAGEGVILTHAMADRLQLRVGDDWEVSTRHGIRRVPVRLVSDRFGYLRPDRSYVLLDGARVESWFGENRGSKTWSIVYPSPGTSSAALVEMLQASLSPARIVDGTTLFRKRVWNIDVDFLVFDLILMGAVVLAGLGMLNSLMIHAHQRRREIALYRALGMTREELVPMLVREGTLLGIAGAGLAIVLGLPSSWLAFDALKKVSGLNLVYRPSLGWTLACVGLCIVVARVASRHPARTLAGSNVAEELRYS